MHRSVSYTLPTRHSRSIPELDDWSTRKFFHRTSAGREQRQAQLRRSEAFLAQAQRLTKTGSIWWKPATGEVAWSDETYRLLEYPLGVTPTVKLMLNRCHPDDLPLVRDTLTTAVRDGATVDFEHRLTMPSGTVKHVRVVFQSVAADGDAPELLGAATDITERKLADEKLRRSEEALGELRSELAHVARVASLGTLAASIAHEVNQPLSAITTNASTGNRMLASETPNVDGTREMIRRILRDANRASEVIKRLRALFTRKAPAMEPVNLNEATREILALSKSELDRARVVTRLELADDLPLVMGDRVQLQQVIINLLRNAVDATSGVEDRPREIVVTTARDAGDHVRMSVRDAGVGFGPHGAEKLFDNFYTTKRDGMGIGLSVSRSIIESHRGRLWAVPNDDTGVTFSFSIPRNSEESTNGLRTNGLRRLA
jgi:signal transduction histidine kinase